MKKINQEWQALRDQGYSTVKIGQMVGKHSSHIARHTIKPDNFKELRRKLIEEGKVELDFTTGANNLAKFNKNRVKKPPKPRPKPLKKAKQKPLDKWKNSEDTNKGIAKVMPRDVVLPAREPRKERKVVIDDRTWLYVKEDDPRSDKQVVKDFIKRVRYGM